MVVTTISHKALNIAVGKDLSIEDIHNVLSDMGMELKSHDEETGDLGVEITPDRLDLISVHGLARAIQSFLALAKNPPKYIVHANGKPRPDGFGNEPEYEVVVESSVKDVRPHTACAVVKNVTITEENLKEIIDVQEKLHATLGRGRTRAAIGIYPLKEISWPVHYKADKPSAFKFIPLNETKEMTGEEILELHEMGKAYAHLLEGKKTYPFFIDANNEILSMPPIINSEKTGRVTSEDKDLFIECSGFDKSLLNQILNNLVTMFADMGAEIHAVKLTYEKGFDGSSEMTSLVSPQLAPLERKLALANVKKRLGLDLSREEIHKLLLKMMYTPVCLDHEVWTLAAPAFRADLWHEVDVIDDIARAYGFNNFELHQPNILSSGEQLPLSELVEDFSELLVGLGFLETYTFALTSDEEQLTNMNVPLSTPRIQIANGMESQSMMRLSLLPQQLTSFFYNQKRPLPQKIFEASFVVLPDESTDVGARNEMHLCALITDQTVTFTQIKQVLDAVLKSRGLSVDVTSATHPSFLEGRTGEIFFKGQSIGFVGELHPQVLENFSLKNPVAAFEINIEPFLKK